MILCLLQLGCVAIHALAIRKRGGPLSLPGVPVSICVGGRVLLRWVGVGNACVSARASPCYALGGLFLDSQAAGAHGSLVGSERAQSLVLLLVLLALEGGLVVVVWALPPTLGGGGGAQLGA